MKKYSFIFLLVMTAAALFSCTKEEALLPDENFDDDVTAVISITSDNILPVNMNGTKAGKLDDVLSAINDINIRINLNTEEKKGIKDYIDYFIDKTNSIQVHKNGNPINTDSKQTYTAQFIGNTGIANVKTITGASIHCNDIAANQITQVQIIANHGSSLHATANWNGVKETEAQNNLGNADGAFCMMYGKATSAEAEYNTHIENGKELKCKLYKVKLKRTRAMISVQINNKNLANGVQITPLKIRLCNVPTECTLTSLNIDDKVKGNAIPKDINLSLATSQEKTFNGDMLSGNPNEGVSSIGYHATKELIPAGFDPMYMFENMQGTFPQTNNGKVDSQKYPGELKTVADLKDRTKSYQYSYIEIEAEYFYKKPKKAANGATEVTGKIIYRFFLGANAYDNFDVIGNHYYRLTLDLSGYGGAAEDGKTDENGNLVVNNQDVSWRVDMNVKDWGFVKDKFDFDGHGFDSYVEIIGTNWSFTDCNPGDPYASWLVINIEKPTSGDLAGQEWTNPTNIAKKNYKLKIIPGPDGKNRLHFNIQPMVYQGFESVDPGGLFDVNTYKNTDTTNKKTRNYREMVITVKNNDTNEEQKVTVRQWVPIAIQVGKHTMFMERFEEYDYGTEGYPWKYNGIKISKFPDLNGFAHDYYWGDKLAAQPMGWNTMYLTPGRKGSNNNNKDGAGSAAEACYKKSLTGVMQGADVFYWALPDKAVMTQMMEYVHDPKWGPFENVHIYDDYWTCVVEKGSANQTYYYQGGTYRKAGDVPIYLQTPDRLALKRVRAIYTNQGY